MVVEQLFAQWVASFQAIAVGRMVGGVDVELPVWGDWKDEFDARLAAVPEQVDHGRAALTWALGL